MQRHRQVGQRERDYLLGSPLTERELAIIRMITQDKNNAEIGRYLGIAGNTVKNHITACFGKLGVYSRVGLAVWYVTKYGNPFRQLAS
jgi:DNA-binding NarL/FixJ family response regulator